MKIKTGFYGFFIKSNGKWCKTPYKGELLTKKDIVDSGVLDDESKPYKEHFKVYVKQVRKQIKKPIKFMQQIWEE